jgi:hypothetical protein
VLIEESKDMTMPPAQNSFPHLCRGETEANAAPHLCLPVYNERENLLPDKIRLAKDYLQRSSFLFDLRIILRTLFKLFRHTSELEQSRRAHSGRLHERH